MQKIHCEVINQPDWAEISFSQPDTYVDVPIVEISETTTSLVISPREEAPAEQHTIKLKVECETIGRINNASIIENISFTPAYVPTLNLCPSKPSRITPPNNRTTIPIIIKNNGNAKTRITPFKENSPDNFSIEFNPPFIDLDMDETGTINLTAVPPSDFQGNITLKVDFTAERFPKREGSPIGGPYSLYFDLYYEPEDTEENDFNPYLIFGIALIIIIICFFIFGRYRGCW